MNLEIQIPQNHDAERKLLGALVLMLPADRDSAIRKISTVWFMDPWHQRLFNVLAQNRRRDFGAEILDAMRDRDGAVGRTAWWIAQLFLDRDGDPATIPSSWKEYAATLQRCHRMRVELLSAIQIVKDKLDEWRIESYTVCDATGRDAEVHDRTPRIRPTVVLDGVTLPG